MIGRLFVPLAVVLLLSTGCNAVPAASSKAASAAPPETPSAPSVLDQDAVDSLAAWAEPTAEEAAPGCSREPASLPRPAEAPGTPDPAIPVDHIVVMMLENHSFDNVLGRLSEPRWYGHEIDGIQPGMSNSDASGDVIEPFHLSKDCVKDMNHSWEGSHTAWGAGANDGFVKLNDSKKHEGYRVMGYYDERDYPLMYQLADRYAVADRFFSSLLAPTQPNRQYFWSGTSVGRTNNKLPNIFKGGWTQKTIFEQLTDAGVSWTFYQTDVSDVIFYTKFYLRNLKHIRPIRHFALDAAAGNLPQVSFVENSTIIGDEHPPFSFQSTQREVHKHLKALVDSSAWERSAFFLVYDEGGGSWDHVPPPRACEPDGIAPIGAQGAFDRYGFRVPALVVSPYARRHHVSHDVYDHTSILKFIETKFNVPALTRRDANADAMLGMFDFSNPDFTRPDLPKPPLELRDYIDCIFKKGYRE